MTDSCIGKTARRCADERLRHRDNHVRRTLAIDRRSDDRNREREQRHSLLPFLEFGVLDCLSQIERRERPSSTGTFDGTARCSRTSPLKISYFGMSGTPSPQSWRLMVLVSLDRTIERGIVISARRQVNTKQSRRQFAKPSFHSTLACKYDTAAGGVAAAVSREGLGWHMNPAWPQAELRATREPTIGAVSPGRTSRPS